MKGKIYSKKGNKVVRWFNGTNLLTGEPYEWEAKVVNPPINTKDGQEVNFKMGRKFEVEVIGDEFEFEDKH